MVLLRSPQLSNTQQTPIGRCEYRLSLYAGGQLPVTDHQESTLLVPAVEVRQPHVAQGACLVALLRGLCRDSNRHGIFLFLALPLPQPRISAPGCGLSVASPVSLGSYLRVQWPVQ